MNDSTFVVMQRNSAGVVSLASGQLTTEREAVSLIEIKADTNPTLEFQIVRLAPTTGWLKKGHLT